MKHSQRVALLAHLNREMLRRGSWCGETHIQKATFLLQEMLRVEMGYEFILYRHGPFSFDLHDQLVSMQADQMLELVVRQQGYGPTYSPTEFGESFLSRFPKTTSLYRKHVEFVADEVGDKGVFDLEKLATALFITNRERSTSVERRAHTLTELKPHIPLLDATLAVEQVERLKQKAEILLDEPTEYSA